MRTKVQQKNHKETKMTKSRCRTTTDTVYKMTSKRHTKTKKWCHYYKTRNKHKNRQNETVDKTPNQPQKDTKLQFKKNTVNLYTVHVQNRQYCSCTDSKKLETNMEWSMGSYWVSICSSSTVCVWKINYSVYWSFYKTKFVLYNVGSCSHYIILKRLSDYIL